MESNSLQTGNSSKMQSKYCWQVVVIQLPEKKKKIFLDGQITSGKWLP
jgi:hypothetical protein